MFRCSLRGIITARQLSDALISAWRPMKYLWRKRTQRWLRGSLKNNESRRSSSGAETLRRSVLAFSPSVWRQQRRGTKRKHTLWGVGWYTSRAHQQAGAQRQSSSDATAVLHFSFSQRISAIAPRVGSLAAGQQRLQIGQGLETCRAEAIYFEGFASC